MKHTIIEYIQPVLRDRYALVLTVLLLILGVIFAATIGISIQPTELQVVTHYTGFGVTNFYRDRWYYLVTFVAFGVIFVVAHIAMACKLYTEKGRMFALGFLWLSVALLIVAWFMIRSIMNIANII